MNYRVRANRTTRILSAIVYIIISLFICAMLAISVRAAADESGSSGGEHGGLVVGDSIDNKLRSFYGVEDFDVEFEELIYGKTYEDLMPLRAEHGDKVFYKLECAGEVSNVTLSLFAVGFVGGGADAYSETEVSYYAASVDNDGNYVAGDPLDDYEYFGKCFEGLGVGQYFLTVYVPSINETGEHEHWWQSADEQTGDGSAVIEELTDHYSITVMPYDIEADGGYSISVTMGDAEINEYVYTGAQIMPAEDVVVTFNDVVLVNGVDYQLTYSNNVNASVDSNASAIVNGTGNFTGTASIDFKIVKAQNRWMQVPTVSTFKYSSYDREVNFIRGYAVFGGSSVVYYTVSREETGGGAIEGLTHFTAPDGVVTPEVEAALNTLPAGNYYLTAVVPGNDNYYGIVPPPASAGDDYVGILPYVREFSVLAADNSWVHTPTMNTWVTGKYDEGVNKVTFDTRFGGGDYVIVVTDTTVTENVVYNSETGVNNLAAATPGIYKMTVTVAATANYGALEFTTTFRVFAETKVGLPWWGTVLIVIGALLLAALIIFILWKKGVFEILTSKMVVAIHTRAMVDATIAAVRAIKMEEEGNRSIAIAEAADKREERKRMRLAERQKTAEERAAELEAKAKVAAERAERMQARAEKMQARADKMKAEAQSKSAVNEAQEEAQTARAEAASARDEALTAQAEADTAHAEAVAEARKKPVEVDFSAVENDEPATEAEPAGDTDNDNPTD